VWWFGHCARGEKRQRCWLSSLTSIIYEENEREPVPESVECFSAVGAILGEGPVWDSQTLRLYTLDCIDKKLFCHETAGAIREIWNLPRSPGSLAIRRNGGMLMAFRRGLALFEPATSTLEDIPTPQIDFKTALFNDGACDRKGRFWIGTFDPKIEAPVGALYRVDRDLTVRRMDTGFTLSNGIAWSPDDRTLYFCDSHPGRIWAYDFDLVTGAVENRRLLVDFEGRKGSPDGCTVDAEGGLWVAAVDAAQILRFDPAGKEVSRLALPVSRPTSVMFGGSDQRTLFITSMKLGLSPEELARQPLAGSVFAADVGVAGLPEPRFTG